MDMERQLVFQGDLFLMEKDSDICQKVSGEFSPDLSLWDQQLIEAEEEQKVDLIANVCENLAVSANIRDTPLPQLIDLASSRYFLNKENKQYLLRRLRKIKLVEKRLHAKQRCTKTGLVLQKSMSSQIQSSFTYFGCDDEAKRQKNRLSAQISRDRKKEYTKQLESDNKMLIQEKQEIEAENKKLKELLYSGQRNTSRHYKNQENNGFISLLIMLGLILLIKLMGTSKKQTKTGEKGNVLLEKVVFTQCEMHQVKSKIDDFGLTLPLDEFNLSKNNAKKSNIPSSLATSIQSIKEMYLH